MDNQYEEKLAAALNEVAVEVKRAKGLFPANFVNQHEGYAVLKEEVEEFWDEVKKNQRNYDMQAQRKEATQVAAMALRILVELV